MEDVEGVLSTYGSIVPRGRPAPPRRTDRSLAGSHPPARSWWQDEPARVRVRRLHWTTSSTAPRGTLEISRPRIVGRVGRRDGRGPRRDRDGDRRRRLHQDPAAWSGFVGLKPTNGVVGRQPIPEWTISSTMGPLDTVADAPSPGSRRGRSPAIRRHCLCRSSWRAAAIARVRVAATRGLRPAARTRAGAVRRRGRLVRA